MKKVFKRVVILLFLFSLIGVLAACNGDKGKTTTHTEDTNNTGDKGERKDLIFLVNVPSEVDPRLNDYSGDFKEEKIERIKYVEEKYNVNIIYKKWPDEAPWGPERQQYIINGVTSGMPYGHFYQIPSFWIPRLAAANAIVPVTSYLRNIVNENFDENYKELVRYKGEFYGFDSGLVLYEDGLYYNYDLLKQLGLESPAKLWLEGQWTWEKLVEYAETVHNQLGDEGYYAIGGTPVDWATGMIPANDGYYIHPKTNQVAFTQNNAIEALNFLRERLWVNNYWEPSGAYDAGSADWKAGKVLFHPGTLWFNFAENRWLNLGFELGYVPYPAGPKAGENLENYRVPMTEVTVFTISAGLKDFTPEELFTIWNDLQYWADKEDVLFNFEMKLEKAYDDPDSLDAHLSIAQKIYNEQITMVQSPGRFESNGYYTVINSGVRNGEIATLLEAIKPLYQSAIDEIHQGS